MRRCSLLLAVILAARAQTPPPQKKPGSVAGVVVNSVTGAFVKNCSVVLMNMRRSVRYIAVTDDGGSFYYPQVESDERYLLLPECFGFTMPGEFGTGPRPPAQVAVGEDQHVENLSLKLIPMGVIAGSVADTDGDPIQGVTLQAILYRYAPEGRRAQVVTSTESDVRGQFRLFGLAPGRYYVHAFRRANPPINAAPERVHCCAMEDGFVPAYFPNAPAMPQARAIEVQAGTEVAGIDFRLGHTPVFHIRGTFNGVRAAARPLAVVPCATPTVDVTAGFSVPIAQNGTFDIAGVPPGQYCIVKPGGTARNTSADAVIVVSDRDIGGLQLREDSPQDLSGTIQMEGDPSFDFSSVRTSLVDTVITSLVEKSVSVAARGSFTMLTVAAGAYGFQLSGLPQQTVYIKKLHVGEREYAPSRIEIPPGAGSIAVILASDAGRISGTVVDADARPAGHALVAIVPRGEHASRRDWIRTLTAKDDGTFEAAGVAPAEYAVLAWESADRNEVTSPDYLKLFEAKAALVTLSSKGASALQVTLIREREIREALEKVP
jgi:hypothetical protein